MVGFEALLKRLLDALKTPPNAPVSDAAPKPVPTPIKSPQERLALHAKNWLGEDPSTPDIANDELGCADSLTKIVREMYPNFPHTVSTITLFQNLKASKHFKATLTPAKGNIIISPRKGNQPGHCGIYLDDVHIASNNSFGGVRGLWTQNYTSTTWVSSFKKKKGLNVYIFQPL